MNPITSNFTRWLVPYCSQDLYLGSSTRNDSSATITGAGDAIFEGALEHWKGYVTGIDNVHKVDKLLVAGISAGVIGLVTNHYGFGGCE